MTTTYTVDKIAKEDINYGTGTWARANSAGSGTVTVTKFSYGYEIVNVKDYATNPNTFDNVALQEAITAIGSTKKTLYIPSGTWSIAASLTFPVTMQLLFDIGSIFNIASNITVTINCPIEAPLSQIFSGSGTVVFGNVVSVFYPEWWGAVGNGTTDDSSAFQKAINCQGTRGGGIVKVTKPNYKISELLMNQSNVVLQGEGRGYSYGSGEVATNTVRLTCTTGDFAIRMTSQASLKNLFIVSNGALNGTIPYAVATAGVEYGVLIEAGQTIMEDVTVHAFQYGCVLANYGNSNKFERCGFTYNTKVGFAVTKGSAAAYACYHPNITAPANLERSTIYTMSNCNIRANGWGMILRDGTGTYNNVLVESNFFGGVYKYVGTLDTSGVSGIWNQGYLEGNWSGFSVAETGYVATAITCNNLLQQTTGVWIPFTLNASDTTLNDAGYQLYMGSVLIGANEGPSAIQFNNLTVVSIASGQKYMYLKSCSNVKFIGGSVSGGVANASGFRFGDGEAAQGTYLANQVMFWDMGDAASYLPTNVIGNKGISIVTERSGLAGLTMNIGRWKHQFDTQNSNLLSTSGTGEDPLMSTYTIAANTIQPNGMRIVASGTITGTAGNKTIKFKWGTEVITFLPAATAAGVWRFEADIPITANLLQWISWIGYSGLAIVGHGCIGATQDLRNAINIQITGECADAGDVITLKTISIKGN